MRERNRAHAFVMRVNCSLRFLAPRLSEVQQPGNSVSPGDSRPNFEALGCVPHAFHLFIITRIRYLPSQSVPQLSHA